MDSEATQILWDIFAFIRSNWNSSDDMSQDQFNLMIKYKVGLNGNYLQYYTAAIDEYNKLFNQTGNKQKALTLLYRENILPKPALPDVANYVLGEFMTMHVAFGGFKAVGYENYRGWMGGGSFEQVPPPYREYNGGGAK